MHWFYLKQSTKLFSTQWCFLTITEFQMGFQKLSLEIVNYQDYKHFGYEKFKVDIQYFFLLTKMPLYIRANAVPFMNEELHKGIMKRSKLIVRAWRSFTLMVFLKKVWFAWPVSSIVYNRKSHFLLVGSGTTTIYNLLNTNV